MEGISVKSQVLHLTHVTHEMNRQVKVHATFGEGKVAEMHYVWLNSPCGFDWKGFHAFGSLQSKEQKEEKMSQPSCRTNCPYAFE